jgi:hypothetical protein
MPFAGGEVRCSEPHSVDRGEMGAASGAAVRLGEAARAEGVHFPALAAETAC